MALGHAHQGRDLAELLPSRERATGLAAFTAALRGIGTANLASVAPGISEALIATAAGLAAAIPAVLGYNYFNNRLRVIGNRLDNFIAEVLNRFEKAS